MKKNEYVELFCAFFRIGILTFGGGLTMLPMLKREVVEKNGWLEEDELLDCYAIGQCTPGIIAVNTATFVGYKQRGVLGGIAATLGMVAPSLLIVSLIATCFQSLLSNTMFQHAIMGIKGVVCALMLNTVITLGKKSLINPICIAVAIVVFILAFFTGFPTIAIVVLAGAFGIVMHKMGGKK